MRINLLPRSGSNEIRRPTPRQQPAVQTTGNQPNLSSPPIIITARIPPSNDLTTLKTEIIAALRSKERYSEEDLDVLEQAFDLMRRFHENETFPNGEKVTLHLLEIARTLCQWGASPVLAAAGLLHLMSLEKLAEESFNPDVCNLILRKNVLNHYLYVGLKEDKITGREARHLVKMCLMQEANPDVWLLEAADSFRTLTSLSSLNKDGTHLAASRAYHVTSPILSMLDLDHLAVKVENIAFMRLDKAAYEQVESLIEDANQRDRLNALKHLADLTELISQELTAIGIKHRVELDVKSVTRTMKKLQKGDELTDASRFRIIVRKGIGDCQAAFARTITVLEALGYMENLQERKNYIAGIALGEAYDLGPKTNGYQSIHIHVRGESFEPINIQVRDEHMHEIAEQGTASHGMFKLEEQLKDVLIDGVVQKKSGQRFGIYEGRIYRLRPYNSNQPIKLIDLLFAISPECGLRAPNAIRVNRIDPLTGQVEKLQLSVFAPLENADSVPTFELLRNANPSRIRANQLNTLTAKATHKMARLGRLDKASRQERASSIQKKGQAALGFELSDWHSQLRQRLTTILTREGANLDAIKINAVFSLERAAKAVGARGEDALNLAIGLANRQGKAKLIDGAMRTIRNSSVALAYRVGAQRNQADLWFMIKDIPGTLLRLLNSFKQHNFRVISLESRNLKGGFSLVKVRVKSRKKDIENDLFELNVECQDLYLQTSPFPPNITTVRQTMSEFRPAKLSLRQMISLVKLLGRLRANIHSTAFPPVLEGQAPNQLQIDIPSGTALTVENRLRQGLKKIGINNFKITTN